jgi:hypothetical protein
MMELTDWRGNVYRKGSRVLYAAMSGRSVELQEAVVVEIYTAYMDQKSYKWKKLKEGEEVPYQLCWNPELQDYTPGLDRVKSEVRVKLQPNGRGSRDFHMRNDTAVSYVNRDSGEEVDWKYISKNYYGTAEKDQWGYTKDYQAVHNKIAEDGWERKETYVTPKPVTLTVIDNITVI